MPGKLIAEFAATNFNPPCLRSGARRVLQGHQAGGMPLSRFHLEYHGEVVSPAVFQPSSDYVSRNTIESSRTIDGGVLSTWRVNAPAPETLVYFSPSASTCMCTLQLWHSAANKATCPARARRSKRAPNGKITAEITIPRARIVLCRWLNDKRTKGILHRGLTKHTWTIIFQSSVCNLMIPTVYKPNSRGQL